MNLNKPLLKPVYIESYSLPDFWFNAIYQCIHHGRDFIIDRGSFTGEKRLEFDYFSGHIINPGYESDININNLLPHLSGNFGIPNPVEDGYLDNYISTYLMGHHLANNESYTYGQRLTHYQIPVDWTNLYNNNTETKNWKDILIQEKEFWEDPKIIIYEDDKIYLNQIELLIKTYQTKGFRNNQMVLQVAHPSDMLLQDPPCLRDIDTRIQEENDGLIYLHFYPRFRSWDLFNGLPANLGGIELLKQYIASEIGVNNGSMVVSSKGVHIYNYVWEIAEAIANKTIDEARISIINNNSELEK